MNSLASNRGKMSNSKKWSWQQWRNQKEFIQVPCFPTLSLLSSFWDHISKWTVVETSILPPYSWYVYSMPASIAGGRWKIFLSHKTNNKGKIKIKTNKIPGKRHDFFIWTSIFSHCQKRSELFYWFGKNVYSVWQWLEYVNLKMPNHVQHSIDNLPDSVTKSADILNLYCPYVTSEMYVNEKLKSCLFFSRFQEEVSDFQFIRFLIIKILKTQRAQTLQVKKKQ